MQGTRFGDLFAFFPDGIVLGLADKATGEAALLPPADTLLGPDEDLVMMRPTSIREADYKPLKQRLHMQLGEGSAAPEAPCIVTTILQSAAFASPVCPLSRRASPLSRCCSYSLPRGQQQVPSR